MYRETVIIGAGPAGVAAAIQLKRCGMEPLLIEKDAVGGLVREANLVENYPGFPSGIKGNKLASLLKKHIHELDITMLKEEVIEVVNYSAQDKNKKPGNFEIKTKGTANIFCKYLVVASGTEPKKLPYAGIEYSILPLLRLRNKRIAIIGAGDCAFDYAINLCKSNKIVILNRDDSPKCLPLLFERVSKIKNIKYATNADMDKELRKSGTYDRVLSAIGRTPCLSFMKEPLPETSPGNLFYAGDVKNGIYRQCSIAAGDGIRAAMEICK
jgi:thioredoxin reductase (NADPH)